MIDIKAIQTRLGLLSDGIAGIETYTTIFRKCGAGLDRGQELAICAARYFEEYGITENNLRLAHLLAQLMHESGNFKYMEEIASGDAYEGRKDLGNINPGDGKLFKGHGPIQITGRANHRKYGRLIGIDLERYPHLAAIPSIGLRVSLEYWRQKRLNALADKDDLANITRAINGGLNGYIDRKAKLAKVREWLA